MWRNGAAVRFTLCFWAKEGDGSGCYATNTMFELNRSGIFAFANESLDYWSFAHLLATLS